MDPCHSQVPSVQSNSRSDQQAVENIYHPIGPSSFSGNVNDFQFLNTPANLEQSFSSNQFQNSSQGFPVGNQWPSSPAMDFQSPMIPNQGHPGYPGHMNQFIPQFPQLPYPASHPSQFMPHTDWMNQDPFFMPPPPPPFPSYNPTLPFAPMSMMGYQYPTHPFMQFGPHQPTMPFSQIKMEPSATMDPTHGYYNMVPHNGQGWQRFYGPRQHQANVFQESASTPNPAPHTITSQQVEETSGGDSAGHSSDKLEQSNVVKIVNSSNHSTNVQNGNNSSDSTVKTSIYHKTTSPNPFPLEENTITNSVNNFSFSLREPEPSSQCQDNSNVEDALKKKNNWSEKLERTRVNMSFSPKARHNIPCSSCFQHQINRSLSVKSAATPNSEDGVIIVPDYNHNVLTGHILCENCGAVNETEEIIEESEDFSKEQLPKDFLTSLKHQIKEPYQLDVYNIGTLSQLHKATPCKPLLSDCPGRSPKITPGSDITNQEKCDFQGPEIFSLPLSSNSKESVNIDTPDTTRRLSMKGIVSMQNKNSSDQVTPPPKKIRICWSCETQQSKGPWHGHKYRENNFLCGECFNMHKKINTRREREAEAEAIKSKEKETIIEISIETEARREKASDESIKSKEKETSKEVSAYNRRDISFKKKKKINGRRGKEAFVAKQSVLSHANIKELKGVFRESEEKETCNEVSFETGTFKKKVITDHNDQDFYLSSPVKDNGKKEKSISSSKVEKKSTRFTRQWAKSQLLSKRQRDISAKIKGRSKPLGEIVEDEDDDIARALREMGEGEQSKGVSGLSQL